MKVAIIGAMDEEVALLREKIKQTAEEQIANCQFIIGQFAEHEVVLLQSGIGKVNAAMSTAILLEKYQPDVIINCGSAGGFSADLEVGDIIISKAVVHHDVDVRAFGYEVGQVPRLPATFEADQRLVQLAKDCTTDLGVQAVVWLIATGDIFIQTAAQREMIIGHFPEVQAGEMEAAAIAQVAYQFGVPFVIIRSLSDIAGKESNISFEKYLEKAAQNSSTLIMNMLQHL